MNLVIPNQNITISSNATNLQLQKAIEAAIPAATEQTKKMAARFRGGNELETCKKIFDFLKYKINYKVDGENQKIQLPSALLRNKAADCKSYSLFTAGILSNLGIPYSLTYASYTPGNKEPEHVYVTTKNGCIIDAVWGKFNSEKKPLYKYQKPMKISYISGIKKPKYKGIGRTNLEWANAVGLKLSPAEKFSIEKNQVSPIHAGAREIILQLIKKNGGGIADFLFSISPFNINGKINPELKSAWDQGLASGEKQIEKMFPIDPLWLANYRSKVSIPSTSGNVILPGSNAKGGYQPQTAQDYQNMKRLELRADARAKLVADLNKKYTWLVYPASNSEQMKQFRDLEIHFLRRGGNPDNFNSAIKEGITKSPRGTDFNYLMGKLASKNFKLKDIGLAIRAYSSVLTGGKRFGLQDPGIWTPWGGFKPGKISGIQRRTKIGVDPGTGTAAGLTAAQWVAAITTVVTSLGVAFINAKWGNRSGGIDQTYIDDPDPKWDPKLKDNNDGGGSLLDDLPSLILPVGIATGAYFLFKDKLK